MIMFGRRVIINSIGITQKDSELNTQEINYIYINDWEQRLTANKKRSVNQTQPHAEGKTEKAAKTQQQQQPPIRTLTY